MDSVLKGDPIGPGQITGSNPHCRFDLKIASGGPRSEAA